MKTRPILPSLNQLGRCSVFLGFALTPALTVGQATFEEIWNLALGGNSSAQFNLGVIHDTGQGVPEDNIEAAKWYRLAADQGNAEAQYNLGVSYYIGEGVPQDYVHAHAWLGIALSSGNEDALEERLRLEQHNDRGSNK